MSRPLTGTKRRVDSGWFVSLPIATGANKRRSHVFTKECDADAWLADGIACLSRGACLPLPTGRLTRDSRSAPQVDGTTFKSVADQWAMERYVELGRGDVDREAQVRTHIKRINTFMTSRGLAIETMTRERVKEFTLALVGSDDDAPAPTLAGMDPGVRVTLTQALSLPEKAARSTIKRRIKSGELKPVARENGADLFTIADLCAARVFGGEAGLRRGPATRGAVSPRVATDVMWVFNQVCEYASSVLQVAVPQDRATLAMPRAARTPPKHETPVDLPTCAEVARRLHAVHQLTLWLMRVLGLRIGEAFGVRVEDVCDFGSGEPGLVRINEQGGRTMRNRVAGGEVVQGDSSVVLKTENSYRVMVAPPMLMDLIRTVIRVFHTDADGTVLVQERLIPGLTEPGRGGQGSFRDALSVVVDELRDERADADWDVPFVDFVGALSLTPHDMRKTLLTDLHHRGVKASHLKAMAGQARGTSVLHRHYLMDDPRLKEARKAAKVVESELSEEVPDGLMVPTMIRCTTGNQPALALSAGRVDTELAEAGWLILPVQDDGPLLNAAEVAQALSVSVQVARRWLADGLVPSVVCRQRARGAERRARLQDVLDVRDMLQGRVTLRRLADELGCSYHLVYQFVAANDLPLDAWGARDLMVPADTEETIRMHVQAQAALRERSVPLSTAAQVLGESAAVVFGLVAEGILVEDDRAADGRRMVTRESVSGQVARQRGRGETGTDLVSWVKARALLGVSDAEFRALVADGTLEVRWRSRARCVTRFSVLQALVHLRPEAILAYAAVL